MDGSERGVLGPSPPSSVPAVLAVKGIAPETALAACGGASVPACTRPVVPPAGLSYPLEWKSRASLRMTGESGPTLKGGRSDAR